MDALFPTFNTFFVNGQLLDLGGTLSPAIGMGILNATPDSFFEGSRTEHIDIGVNKAIEMFLDDFNLCEDVYCFEAARQQYYKILKSLKDKEIGVEDEPEDER